jgi:hypothetical protein
MLCVHEIIIHEMHDTYFSVCPDQEKMTSDPSFPYLLPPSAERYGDSTIKFSIDTRGSGEGAAQQVAAGNYRFQLFSIS